MSPVKQLIRYLDESRIDKEELIFKETVYIYLTT